MCLLAPAMGCQHALVRGVRLPRSVVASPAAAGLLDEINAMRGGMF